MDNRNSLAELDAELANLVEAVAKSGYHSPLVMNQIAERERELSKVTQWLSGSDPHHVEKYLADVRQFVESRFSQIESLLYADVERARAELSRHVDQIIMTPVEKDGRRYYMASGEWELLEKDSGPRHSTAPMPLEVVAGDRFERSTFGL